MRRALVVNPYWDTLGGGERYVSSVAKVLLDHGWSVDIAWKSDISPAIKAWFGLDISAARFVSRYSLLERRDLVFWVSDGSLPLSFADSTLIHLQFPFRGVSGRSLPNLLKSRFYKFVVNSGFTKQVIDTEFLVDSRILYPPIATADFTPGRKTPTILFVGRFSNLTQSKGHHFLVEQFCRLSPQLPGWKLILAGGALVGASDASLRQLRDMAAGYPVDLVLNPSLADLRQLYAQASIFWSASGYGVDPVREPLKVEHFGISVVEAMASGCVPVVIKQGGHLESVDHEVNGFLWSDFDQLQEYTLRLIKDHDLYSRLSQAAIAKSKIFDTSAFSEACLKLI